MDKNFYENLKGLAILDGDTIDSHYYRMTGNAVKMKFVDDEKSYRWDYFQIIVKSAHKFHLMLVGTDLDVLYTSIGFPKIESLFPYVGDVNIPFFVNDFQYRYEGCRMANDYLISNKSDNMFGSPYSALMLTSKDINKIAVHGLWEINEGQFMARKLIDQAERGFTGDIEVSIRLLDLNELQKSYLLEKLHERGPHDSCHASMIKIRSNSYGWSTDVSWDTDRSFNNGSYLTVRMKPTYDSTYRFGNDLAIVSQDNYYHLNVTLYDMNEMVFVLNKNGNYDIVKESDLKWMKDKFIYRVFTKEDLKKLPNLNDFLEDSNIVKNAFA